MNPTRVGVMGGTFDPIHLGHLFAAVEAAKRLNLQRVIFVPAGEPWQKGSVTELEHRVAMVKLAIADYPNFEISLVDANRVGPTYTIDTISDLAAANPDDELYFIVGADSVENIHTWKNSAELLSKAKFIGVSRPGHKLNIPANANSAFTTLEISALDISSSEIRDRVLKGKTIDQMAPEPVISYIEANGLYKGRQ